jgi:thymidylate synthase
MAESFISDLTLDDLMNSVFRAIQTAGTAVRPTKGANVELRGILLQLKKPRARLSRTETRGKPFSCLGEFCWYLSGSDDLDFIKYYIPAYEKEADEGLLCGAYGPRLVGGQDQLGRVVKLLSKNPDSRRAVVQVLKATDLESGQRDVPCTCTLQFLLREDALDLLVNMRSNDAYKGLPHDVFCFTMIQELLARRLSVEMGTYKHMVSSLHLYDQDVGLAQQFLDEGFQSTKMMPGMPAGDPLPALEAFLRIENAIRTKGDVNERDIASLDPYWADLARLLLVFRYHKDGHAKNILGVRGRMASSVYNAFIDKKYEELQRDSR